MIPMVDLHIQFQALKEEMTQAILEVLEGGQYILGPRVRAFEEAAASYLGVRHAVGVASGTDALILALQAAGLSVDDEVITTPFSFIATASAICHLGAKPVFVDIDPSTFNIDLNKIEAAITPRTRVVLPVHLFGQPVNMTELMQLAQRHNLQVIEDCAQSFGAGIEKNMTGSFGLAGCFSFYPSKNIGCYGDGGLVVTAADDAYAERLRMLRNHGSRTRYQHDMLGFSSRLDEIQAAVLLVKLKHIDTYNQNRRRVAENYNRLLAHLPVMTPYEDQHGVHIYHQYTILTEQRDALINAFNRARIASAVYYPVPLHKQPVFADAYRNLSLPVVESIAERCLSLPIFPEMSEQQIEQVVDVMEETLN